VRRAASADEESGFEVGRQPRPRPQVGGDLRIVGESAAAQELRRHVDAVAGSAATVLLTGETGTGKGLVARLVHQRSLRCARPFVHVDCAALSSSVIESELFGHERGAFTGAWQRRVGRFEQAGEGTIFLDEIGELEPPLQAKLLRALQDRVFERVGGGQALPVRARVVAATNRDLPTEIAAGRFRADLYYRLQVFEIAIPPLRERRRDVPPLFARAVERFGAANVGVSESFQEVLCAYDWPGNVRQVMNLAERLLVAHPGGPWGCAVLAEALGLATRGRANGGRGAASGNEGARPRLVSSRSDFEERERLEIARALALERWNVSAAARALGVSRGALRGRMARLGIG
jgi:transcriptional regulator with GAF, ATPase, and Fis domain